MHRILLFLLHLCFIFTLCGQSINGKITELNTGEAVIGASIENKRTALKTVSDVNGEFKIEANAGDQVEISNLNFITQTFTVPADITAVWNIKLESAAKSIGAANITHSRLKEKLRESPVTVESLGIQSIKETPASDFYEALGHLKGVDLTTASMGFKVINTRGFNSTSPVRSLQLIDGVDNQAPGLNFSLGNFLGASELDIFTTDIVVGASSAYYGPNAFNGVIKMTTKSPWEYRGLSGQVKLGERDLGQIMLRYADVRKNKSGRECFAYKINLMYMRAYDWQANNLAPTSNSVTDNTNPGGYDAINRYGDEYRSDNPSPSSRRDNRAGMEYFYRTGYLEKELVSYNTRNLKTNVLLAYKINDKNEIQFSSSFGTGSTVYQGDNRYRLDGVLFFQNRLEWIGKKGYLRFYATHEDAGKTYDVVLTALLMQQASLKNEDWAQSYSSYWQQYMGKKVKALPGFPKNLFDPKYDSLYFSALGNNPDSLNAYHQVVRQLTDLKSAKQLNYETYQRFEPGTARFDSLLTAITSRRSFDKDGNAVGSRFFDQSALYHITGERRYNYKDWKFTSGFSGRLYRPYSLGTLFLDTGNARISNSEAGVYSGLEKRLWKRKLKLDLTARLDKNVNFNFLFSPAASLLYSKNKINTYRVSFSSALRNPTLQDQYLRYNVGPAILLGNIKGINTVFTPANWLDAIQQQNHKILDTLNIAKIKPERVRTFEFSYKGVAARGRITIDAGYYFSMYKDFIGYKIVVDGQMDTVFNRPLSYQVYRVATNSQNNVSTQGLSLGMNYFFWKFMMLSGNWSWNKLDRRGSSDPLIPAFNTPRHKFNVSLGASSFNKTVQLGTKKYNLKNYGFNANFKWVEGFTFEGSPQFTGDIASYYMLDVQVSRNITAWKSILKIGASNITNNKIYQVYGGPQIGRLAYISLTFEP
ncbi:MAG: TonB-dependent receptor plug domain-containing protein [Bacteroidia bacterium]|nr:TonB-dependent receptor plug domain-containing protein [Bacteroidia bacterium]